MLQLSVNKMARREQLQFLADLIDWLNRGSSPNQALQMMYACAEELQNKRTRLVVQHIQEKLAYGRSLSESLSLHFDSDLVLVMKSSHDPQQLNEYIEALRHMEEVRTVLLRGAFKKLFYPSLLLVASLVAVWFAGTIILPRLESMSGAANSLFWTQQLKGTARLLPWLLLLIFIITGGFVLSVGTQMIKQHQSFLQGLGELTRSKVYELFTLSDICYSLGMLLQQEMNLSEAVHRLSEQAAGQAQLHYQHMKRSLALGLVSLTEVMHSRLVDRITLMRLQMSAGSALERSQQLKDLAFSVQERAVRRMQKKIWMVTAISYGVALFLIALLTLGFGQAVMNIVTDGPNF